MKILMGILGIYDFFNLVIAGGIFLLGLKILNITEPMSWAYPDNEHISIAIIFFDELYPESIDSIYSTHGRQKSIQDKP